MLILAALLEAVVVAVPGDAASGTSACGPLAVAGHWPMNEPPGSATMIDVAGGHDGNVRYTRTGLTIPAHPGFEPFYRFGRSPEFPSGSIVTVADADALDPGPCDFAVDVWVNWDAVTPDARNRTTFNVVQKGLSTAPANWKLEVDGGQRNFGQALCIFDGANDGRGAVRVRSSARVANDDRWTALRCERRGSDFTVTVNGGAPVKVTVAGVGPIENLSSLTVGAKKLNDDDTFRGEVDDLVFWTGRQAA